jgi:hypothetical protein
MNKIRFNRLLLAGFVSFLVWVIAEILVEQVIGRVVFGDLINRQWLQVTNILNWSVANHLLNTFIGLMNCMVLIWLYGSLRPMFGVGTKTALITSAFGIIFGVSMNINAINLGLIPPQLSLLEMVYELIEFPIAMIAGAAVYEGSNEAVEAV